MLLQHIQTWRSFDGWLKSNILVSIFVACILSFSFVSYSMYANEANATISNGSRNLHSFTGEIPLFTMYCGDPNSTALSNQQVRCFEDVSTPLKMYGIVVPTRVVCALPPANHMPVAGAETQLATTSNGWFCPPNEPLTSQKAVEYLWFNIICMFAITAFVTFSVSMFVLYFLRKNKHS